jgi:hypothetical protein
LQLIFLILYCFDTLRLSWQEYKLETFMQGKSIIRVQRTLVVGKLVDISYRFITIAALHLLENENSLGNFILTQLEILLFFVLI